MKRNFLLLLCLLSFHVLLAQDLNITGTVTDAATGDPLIGASVMVKGTTRGTQTDATGSFSISAPANATLVVNYLGYKRQEFPVNNQTSMRLQLTAGSEQLQEVVVTGYGTQQKRDVTGSISSVKSEEFEKQASQNPVSSLQGKVAGVNITNSGQPGASPSVRIRGAGSVLGKVEPIYVVDGTIVNDLTFLNPNDIESMEVLKDASSASIYGVRAANGVILVTTKRGQEGKPVINYNGFVGVKRATNVLEMANAQEYATLINEKLGTETVDPNQPSTDWYDQILRTATIHNHHVSVSGGSERLSYSFSGGYLNEEGIIQDNVFERITARLQTDAQLTDNIKVGYNAIFSDYESDDVPGSVLLNAFVAPPILRPFRPDGSYGDPADIGLGNFSNPQASLDRFNQISNGQRLVGNTFGEVKFLNDLLFRTSLSLEYGINEFRNYQAQDSLTTVQFSPRSRLTKSRAKENQWLWENTLTYTKTFGDHDVTALLGTSAQEIKSETLSGSASDVPFDSDATLFLNLGDPETFGISNTGDLERYNSYFGRINYSFKQRYLLTATLRRDASSKFPRDTRWDNFPSIGLGWVVTEEPFMQDQTFVDFLKLRASYGKLGNAGIPTGIADLTATIDPRYTAFFGVPPIPYVGGSIVRAVPNTLLWEVVNETNIGVELHFLESRLTLEADWYNKETQDAIFDVPNLGTGGLSSPFVRGNFADFRNRGLEIVANWSDNMSADFSYNIGANVSFNRNEVTGLSAGDTDQPGGSLPIGGYFTNVSRIGSPIGSYYGFEVDGIFQNEQEVANSSQPSAKPGDFRYRDMNGDGVIDNRDKVILGNPNPGMFYGINTSFNFRSFDFLLDIQGVADVDVYNANKGIRVGNENYTKEFFDNRWSGPGTSNSYPSADVSRANLEPNSWFVEDGSYIRIRNVQFGYTLQSDLVNRLKMQRVRFYVNAQNPVTWFSYNGFTPEIGGAPNAAGIDLNVYPLSATYNLGVNVNF
ncbi:TonB-dependent receptor [Pontibacter sp. JH31]|uniref:TonB-dependent receptor n=1 Tax=Pontibacter aquaedesilientis TaxID=2766980 RepID=A0ABR7XDL6_9BACT|nr:TonB-dependent receptor [Pontibacter aquaedesilientis]MBD1396385.1 TonB-dependent receptor [Pontibacter aquaedesilientis]